MTLCRVTSYTAADVVRKVGYSPGWDITGRFIDIEVDEPVMLVDEYEYPPHFRWAVVLYGANLVMVPRYKLSIFKGQL